MITRLIGMQADVEADHGPALVRLGVARANHQQGAPQARRSPIYNAADLSSPRWEKGCRTVLQPGVCEADRHALGCDAIGFATAAPHLRNGTGYELHWDDEMEQPYLLPAIVVQTSTRKWPYFGLMINTNIAGSRYYNRRERNTSTGEEILIQGWFDDRRSMVAKQYVSTLACVLSG